MASLRYPPGTFIQSVKQRHRALAQDQVLLVVEGADDKRFMAPLLTGRVHILPARGRDMVLAARSGLRSAEFDRCIFLVDCDDDIAVGYKGHPNLVITTFRDLDADGLLALKSYNRISSEYFYDLGMSPDDLQAEAQALLDYAVELSCAFGQCKAAARTLGLRLRIVTERGESVSLPLSSMPSVGAWIGAQRLPDLAEICGDMAGVLGWNGDQVGRAVSLARSGWLSECRHHGVVGCTRCRTLSLCAGHDLTAAIAVDLSIRLSSTVTTKELERLSRMGTDRWHATRWTVGQRLRAWADSRGLDVVRNPSY